MTNKIALALSVLAIALSATVLVAKSENLGGNLAFQKQSFYAGFFAGDNREIEATKDGALQVGTGGTEHTKIISGTCNLTQSVVGSFTASTTKQHFCAVTGAASGDRVFVSLPLGAGSTGLGFVVQSAYASSSNMIGVSIGNFTGSASSTYAQATTSVQYLILDS